MPFHMLCVCPTASAFNFRLVAACRPVLRVLWIAARPPARVWNRNPLGHGPWPQMITEKGGKKKKCSQDTETPKSGVARQELDPGGGSGSGRGHLYRYKRVWQYKR